MCMAVVPHATVSAVEVLPDDAHNARLLAQAHPRDWRNPVPRNPYNLVVIGAGPAGLIAAAGAAGLGARVALVEKHLMGGDCLNYGCVPSKGLLRAAHAVQAVREADVFGIQAKGSITADFASAMERMRRLRSGISANDSAHRLAKLGVDVFLGQARFLGPDAIEVDGQRLTFSRAIIATGGRASGMPLPGLEKTGFLTNETVFSLTQLPRRLVVIGGGPIGCELAQAFRHFGAAVTMLHADDHVLPREDPDAA